MIHTVGSLLLSLSCSGALMIILVCAISHIFRKKSSFRWQYYIWILVIARLLMPFAPEGNLMAKLGEKFEVQKLMVQKQPSQEEGQAAEEDMSYEQKSNTETDQKVNSRENIKGFTDAAQNEDPADSMQKHSDTGQDESPVDSSQKHSDMGQDESPADSSQKHSETSQNGDTTNDSLKTGDANQDGKIADSTGNQGQSSPVALQTWKAMFTSYAGKILQRLESVQKYLFILWLVVAIFLIIRKVTIYQCFVRYIGAGSTPISDINRLEALSAAEQEIGIKRALELWSNPMVSSPMLIGIIHPCIVLPEGILTEKAFHYTILHELIHYKRRDLIYKWLGQIVLCIHWFNPLVYIMTANIGRLCEFSCDEAVSRRLCSGEGRREYAQTLLEAMKAGGNYREHLASITLSENKKMLKERMEAIMSYEKMTTKNRLLATVLTAGIFVGALYAGSYTANAADGTIKLDTAVETAGSYSATDSGMLVPETIIKAAQKTGAQSESKLQAKSKASTSASSSSATTSKSKTNATSDAKLIAKSQAGTTASSESKTSAKPNKNTSAKSYSSTSQKSAKKQTSDKITAAQADKMALALTKEVWVWDWVAFYVPYMSDAGVKKLLPVSRQADWAGSVDFTTGKKIKFTKKKINAARKKKTSESLTRKDIDKHALMIMESNGNWDCISAMLPCMTHSGIDAVVHCYNSKQFGNKKHAEDYY